MVKTLTSLVPPVRTAAPAGPVAGQVYFNDTDNTLYWYSGTSWVASRIPVRQSGPIDVFPPVNASRIVFSGASVVQGATADEALVTVPNMGSNDWPWTDLTYVSGTITSAVPQYRVWNGMLQSRFQAGTTITAAAGLSVSAGGSITDMIWGGIPVAARVLSATSYFPVLLGNNICIGCLTVNGEMRIVVADSRNVAYTIAQGTTVVGVSPLYPAGF